MKQATSLHVGVATRGFAAVAAVFLLVVLAALGAFMLTFSNTQQLTSAQDVQGSRAYWAARAGLEWGIGSVFAVADPATLTTSTCTTATPLSLSGFSVSVGCTLATYTEDGGSRYLVQILSTATVSGAGVGTVGYIERQLSASLER